MSRGVKRLLVSVALLLLLFGGALAVLVTLDWNLIKPQLNARVSAALQRPFAIEGPLQVSWQRQAGETGWRGWLPWPRIRAQQLTLGNPEGMAQGGFVELAQVEFRLSPLALFEQRLVIPRIELSAPQVALERLADGRSNWRFDSGEPAQPSRWRLEIGELAFDRARIAVRDAQYASQFALEVEPLGAPIVFKDLLAAPAAAPGRASRVEPAAPPSAATPMPAADYAFAWRVEGRYRDQPLSGAGRLGGLLALREGREPLAVQADLHLGSNRVRLSGTLTDPLNLAALDLQLALSGSTLASFYPMTGVALPETPAFATEGRLRARLRAAGGPVFHYQDFTGRIGGSDIGGDVTYVLRAPRPKLSAVLVSEALRFEDLAPLIGARRRTPPTPDTPAAERRPAGKVLPVTALNTERWQAMDADVQFTGKRIVHSEQLPFTDLYTHLLLDQGQLRLEPLRFGVAGGRLEARIRLEGATTPLRGQARVSARHLQLKQLVPGFEPMQTSLGELNGDADLRGSGASIAALLGSADGEVQLLINDGAVSRGLMEIAGLNLGNYLVSRLFGDDTVKINCALADIEVRQGVARPRVMVVDTENARIEVAGSIDMARERLDLSIDPEAKGLRLLSLRSPLYVRGPFGRPDAGVDALPLAARGAGLLVGVAVAPWAGLLALVVPGRDAPESCRGLLQPETPAAGASP
ncbi:MAG: AsmA family protein [Pseudomonas sp.]|uniref:AsmA family protein n=1 Tax=Pseudomonas sp. TaxID=306 RepID=UPI003397A1F2